MDVPFYEATLSNGIKVVLIDRNYSQVAAIRIYCRAGSRYDPVERGLSGLAHLTEHLLFGNKRRIFSEIESRGGRIDAGTSREYMFVSAVVLTEELFSTLEIITDIVAHPDFTPADVESEKLIVAEELNRRQDQEAIVLDLFLSALFENHPLGNPVFGSTDGFMQIGYDDVVDFYAAHFSGRNMVISICGDVQPDAIEAYLEEKFSTIPSGQTIRCAEQFVSPGQKRVHREMALKQTHLLMGFPAPDMQSPERYAFKLLDIILGTGANSLLYQQLRQQETLVYSIYSLYQPYEDAGYFAVKTSCAPENLQKVEKSIHNQIRKLHKINSANSPPLSHQMIMNAKKQYEGRLYRSFETNSSIAAIFGIEKLLSQIELFHKSVEKVNAVSIDDIAAVVERWIPREDYVIITVGQVASSQ